MISQRVRSNEVEQLGNLDPEAAGMIFDELDILDHGAVGQRYFNDAGAVQGSGDTRHLATTLVLSER